MLYGKRTTLGIDGNLNDKNGLRFILYIQYNYYIYTITIYIYTYIYKKKEINEKKIIKFKVKKNIF